MLDTALQTKTKGEGGEEVLQVPKQSPLKEIIVRACCSPTCQEGPGWSRHPPAAHGSRWGCPEGPCSPRREPTLDQVYPEGLQPTKETHAAAGHEQLQQAGVTFLQHSMKDCIPLCPMSGPPGQRREGV